MTDRSALILAVARLMGAPAGTVGASTITSAVLNGLINTTGSDSSYANQTSRLIFPIAPDEASKQTLIDSWTDLSGTATFAARSAFVAGETYILVQRQDYTLAEFRDALSEALRKSKRSYRRVVAAIPGETQYTLSDMTWLQGGGDIDAVFTSPSPIMLQNENYDLWQDGPNAAPDGYELIGADGEVERTDGAQRGAFSVTMTRNGTNVYLRQALPLGTPNVSQNVLQAGQWITCSVADRAWVGIWDGSAWTKAYHSGSGIPEFVQCSLTPTATMTALAFDAGIDTGDTSAVFSGPTFVQDTQPIAQSLQNYGSSAYAENRYNAAIWRNVGGAPQAIVQVPPGNNQIIIYCRRPFEQVTSDDQFIEDQYERVLEAGLAVYLLTGVKAGVDRTRYDRVLKEQAPIWATFIGTGTDLPTKAPLTRVSVLPA